jgi:PTH1 family peptidyl-tRNA hydrolase
MDANDNETKVIVGLGNPGLEYARTRHNMGFMIVDGIGTANGAPLTTNSRLKCDFSKFTYRGKTIMLVKPMTYMNLSGECLVAVKQWFKLPVSSFIVVHDDVALPLGKLRVVNGGGAGGQHGVESIIECLGGDTSIVRLKFGVGPDPGGDRRAGYVLSRVPETQQELLEQSLDLAKKCLFTWINEDTLKAMNKYNSIDLRPEAIAEKKEKERKRAQQAQERRESLENKRLENERLENERLDRERQESEKAELKNSQSKGDNDDVAQT